jgi:serine/threonine-protein kinase
MPEVTAQLKTALADRYVIERELGAGGMATVYLAHDVKHNRKVALKVLKPELAAVIGAERFLKEIEVTANLQHPHILPLHDSGEAGTFLYYVMPYVEGETLRDKMDREKQLSIEDAVETTRSVAAALDYAHRHDVIHRDIKPENILMHDGQPLIADFGIALAVSHAGGERLTETGLSIGTPHYMSPEQAMGDREMDARSDVYSLGAMMYEMLTGDPPYTGSTAQAIVAKVITEKAAPVTAARPTTPPNVAASIDKALQKLPADRFLTAASFADALARPGWSTGAETVVGAAAAAGPRSKRWSKLVVPGVVVLLAATAVWGWLRPASVPEGELIRFTVPLPPEQDLFENAFSPAIAVSPDGHSLVYSGVSPVERQLYLRRFDDLSVTPIPNTEGAYNPFFSPDGRWVGFVAADRIKKVDLLGGPALTVTELGQGTLMAGAAWSTNDTIYFAHEIGEGLSKVAAAGGQPVPIVLPDTTKLHWWPELLPGEKDLLVSVFAFRGPEAAGFNVSSVAAVNLETGEVKPLVDDASFARYMASGHLLVRMRDGSVVAAPFDAERLELTGPLLPVLDDVAATSANATHLSVSRNGVLSYLSGAGAGRTVVLVDREGRETPLLTDARQYEDLRLSPDGKRLAIHVTETDEGDIWIHESETGTLSRLTFESENFYPVWTPDGRRIAYTSRSEGVAGLFWKPSDGSGAAERLLPGDNFRFPGAFSPDGKLLIYRETSPSSGFDIYAVPMDGERVPQPILVTPLNEVSPVLSPDGRWMAYVSDETSRAEVYVRAFPQGGARWQVSTDGGTEPVWSRDGRELFYRSGPALMVAPIDAGETFHVGPREELFTGPYHRKMRWAQYDVHPDGEHFVMIKTGGLSNRMVVVLNWFQELERRMAAQGGE